MVAQLQPLNNVMESAASRLKQLIDESGMSNVELAKKIGKTKSLISTYLNPDRQMGATFLQLLEDKLGWSSRWIRTGSGPKFINKEAPKNEATEFNQLGRANSANYKSTVNQTPLEMIRMEEEIKRLKQQLADNNKLLNFYEETVALLKSLLPNNKI